MGLVIGTTRKGGIGAVFAMKKSVIPRLQLHVCLPCKCVSICCSIVRDGFCTIDLIFGSKEKQKRQNIVLLLCYGNIG
jgi:hypothetical protein